MTIVDLISLGGTIAMTPDPSGAIVPTLGADDLLRRLPGTSPIATVEPHAFRSLPGAHLVLPDLIELAAHLRSRFASGVDGAVITQGTDTIEESAYALDLLLPGPNPVVVTGAMRGADAVGSDGAANVDAAIGVAAHEQAVGRGVLVVLDDEVHAARWVTKTHTARLGAFCSPSTGPVAEVAEGDINWFWPPTRTLTIDTPSSVVEAWVPLIVTWLGDDGILLDSVIGQRPGGLVIQALGAGHVPTALVDRLHGLAQQIPVVLATRVAAGPVHRRTYGFTGSERDLLARGLIWGGSLSGPKARILLALAIAAGWSRQRIAAAIPNATQVDG
jgi:L-asparaginase